MSKTLVRLLFVFVPIVFILIVIFNPTIRHAILTNNGPGKIIQTSKDSSLVIYKDSKNGFSFQYDNQVFYSPFGDTDVENFELKGDHCIPRLFIEILPNPQNLPLSDFISTQRRYANPMKEPIVVNGIEGIKVVAQPRPGDNTRHDYHYHFIQGKKVIDFFYSDSNRKKYTSKDCQNDEAIIKSTMDTFKLSSGS